MKTNSVIDWRAFGAVLKASRLKNGYTCGAALAEAVQEQTGMAISERTVYALEDATRTPSADIFFALQMVLPELSDPAVLRPLFKKQGVRFVTVDL